MNLEITGLKLKIESEDRARQDGVLNREHEDYVKRWKNKDAAKYAVALSKKFGKVKMMGPDMLAWENKAGFTKVWILDESVKHDFPVPHKDFVYSTRNIKVSPDIVGKLAAVSGSIMVDGLKGEVTARCGGLIKNAVTLGYVEDVVAGKVSGNLKDEYSKRIKGNITPAWYKDLMGEAE